MATKINKPEARKRFDKGETITLNPCKMHMGGEWSMACKVSNSNGNTFDAVCNSFSYYNCMAETGLYPHFYIE